MIQVSGASADCGVSEEICSADCRVVCQKPLKDTLKPDSLAKVEI